MSGQPDKSYQISAKVLLWCIIGAAAIVFLALASSIHG